MNPTIDINVTDDWKTVHQALLRLAQQKGEYDAEEARWLLAGERAEEFHYLHGAWRSTSSLLPARGVATRAETAVAFRHRLVSLVRCVHWSEKEHSRRSDDALQVPFHTAWTAILAEMALNAVIRIGR